MKPPAENLIAICKAMCSDGILRSVYKERPLNSRNYPVWVQLLPFGPYGWTKGALLLPKTGVRKKNEFTTDKQICLSMMTVEEKLDEAHLER